MKSWQVSTVALLSWSAAWSAMGCNAIAGIGAPVLEGDASSDATVAPEDEGGTDSGPDSTLVDAGGDAEDAAPGPTEDGGDATAADAGDAGDGGIGDASKDAGLPRGTPCVGDAGGGCASGFCVDGVCCEGACSGQCEACNLPDAGGLCTQTVGAPVAPRGVCAGAGTSCVGACAAGNTLGCTYPGSATSCRSQTCTGGTVTQPAGCDGSGTCPPATTVTCSNPAACNATNDGCSNACTGDGQCSGATPYCNSGSCLATKENGLKCAAASECTSKSCVDGYCCNSSCTNDCQACDVPNNLGACTQVAAGDQPHGTSRPACTGAGGACGGSCQTTSATQCTYPTGSCGAASCTGSTFIPAGTCASGLCAAAASQSCPTCETCNSTQTQCIDSTAGTACGAAGQACNAGSCVTIGAPRPTAPLSTALATSQKPTFHWALGSGTTGAQVQICKDRACSSVLQTFTATGASGAPATALGKGVYFWRLHGLLGSAVGSAASPVWELRVGAKSAPIDTSWGTIVDPNGDGFADLLVAAKQAGAAYLYPSTGTAGISTTASATLKITNGASFGYAQSLASAGDVNGDGFSDVIVGASGNAAYVYLGGASGLSTTAATTITPPSGALAFGASVSSAGDVNGDGYADVIVGSGGSGVGTGAYNGAAYIYLGSASGTTTTPAPAVPSPVAGTGFGYQVASAGDTNGDGYGDVIVGGSGYASSPGVADVFLGGPGGLSTTPLPLSNPNTDGTFGASLAGVDDTNADGYADIVVGAYAATSNEGIAYLYLGKTFASPNGASPDAAGFEYGQGVAGAGDLNGDGYADYAVYASGADSQRGWVYIFLGSVAVSSILSDPNEPAVGNSAFFGGAMAAAGDVNGDGFGDFAVGASANASSAGNAYVFPGNTSTGGISTTPVTTLTGAANSSFGSAIQ
jgi:hypothetical protein